MKHKTIGHPKLDELKERLGVRRPTAVGYLEMLFHFAAQYTPRGNIGKYSDRRIEAALEWSGKAGALVAALLECNWIEEHPEHRLIIHDWAEHADQHTRRRVARMGEELVQSASLRRGNPAPIQGSLGLTPEMPKMPPLQDQQVTGNLASHIQSQCQYPEPGYPSPTPSDAPRQPDGWIPPPSAERSFPRTASSKPRARIRDQDSWLDAEQLDDILALRKTIWQFGLGADAGLVLRLMRRARRAGLNTVGAAHAIDKAWHRVQRQPGLRPENPGWFFAVIENAAKQWGRRGWYISAASQAPPPLTQVSAAPEHHSAAPSPPPRKPPQCEFHAAIAQLAEARRFG